MGSRKGARRAPEVPKEVQARIQFVLARTVREVLDVAFGVGALPRRADASREQALPNSREQVN